MEEFISKLNKLDWIDVDGKKLVSREGFTLFYDVSLHHTSKGGHFPPVKTTWYLQYKNRTIFSYGCMSEETTRLIVNFYTAIERFTSHSIYDKENENEKIGEEIWNSII